MDTAIVNIDPTGDKELQAHYTQAQRLRDYAIALKVGCSMEAEAAAKDLSMIAQLKKAMDEKRKEYTVPLDQHKKAIMDTFKELMAPVEEADSITREKVLAFKQAELTRQAEEERINAMRLEAAQAEMALKGEISEPVDLLPVDHVSKNINTDMGTTGMVTVRKWEVVDFSQVPDDLKMIDGSKVTKLVKAGIGWIAGVHIYTEDTLRVTPRGEK